MWICADDDPDSTEESDSDYESQHDSAVVMSMEDDVDALYGDNSDTIVEMERDVSVKMQKLKRREMTMRMKRKRIRIWMRMKAKNLRRSARERW